MTPERQLSVADFPRALHDEIAERLCLFSVGFSQIVLRKRAEWSYPSGSGTLVRLLGAYAIVTADHVVEQLQKGNRIGLLTDWNGGLRRCAFDCDHVTFARLARGKDDGNGPDLAVIFLPNGGTLSSLVAHKAFYDLDRRITTLGGVYPGVEYGFWFPCGVIAEGAQDLGPMRSFARVQGVWGLCAIAARPNEFELDGFDYLDIRVPDQGEEIPRKLNGMSGSGLWQVRVRQRADGAIYVEDYLLSGVAFYEWRADGRRLRCHGRGSIHERLPALLAAHSPRTC